MPHTLKLLLFTLTALAALGQYRAVEFYVINNAISSVGGVRFNDEIGLAYTEQIMNSSIEFVWKLLNETTFEDRKPEVRNVTLFVETLDGVAETDTETFQMRFSTEYLGNYTGDLKTEFTGIMYHEMTHVWQWFANEEAPVGLTEGIADFVRLKAGLAPSHWAKPGQGDRWDHGYDVTALFLDYCDGLWSGFVAELNKKMRSGYRDDYFVELSGKKVDELWSDYKAKYGG